MIEPDGCLKPFPIQFIRLLIKALMTDNWSLLAADKKFSGLVQALMMLDNGRTDNDQQTTTAVYNSTNSSYSGDGGIHTNKRACLC